MDCALHGDLRASPSDLPVQAPHGVGCLQRPSREHERPAPRLRVRPFPATCDPAGTSASADFSTASGALSSAAVPSHPANTPSVTGHPGTPAETSPDKPATFTAHPPRLRDGPLMASGFAVNCRLARTAPPSTRSPSGPKPSPHAPCVPRVAISPPASFPPRLTTTQLPSTCGWCHQPPQGTHTPKRLDMPGVHDEGRPGAAFAVHDRRAERYLWQARAFFLRTTV